MIELDSPEHWPQVTMAGLVWAVSSRMLRIGISIGEAAQLAEQNDCVLPTPDLVLAIHAAADCRIEPMPWRHDGTPATMSSPAVVARQQARVDALVASWEASHGRRAVLVSGESKDVVRDARGRIGLFGWIRSDGRPIQSMFTGHSVHWADASQGLRLCRRVASAAA